jgi:hypothetical protein
MLRRLRHDWPVRWAHHPLCARHAMETWRIGRLHLCRGCSCLALGAAGGGLAALATGGPWCLWALALLAPPVLLLSWPPRYPCLPRALRDALRLGAGVLVVLAAWSTWHFPAQAWPALPLLFLTWRGFVRVRARVQARACDGCPELGAGGVCSGYRLQAACVRSLEAQLERDLGDALAGTGPLPPWLGPRREPG